MQDKVEVVVVLGSKSDIGAVQRSKMSEYFKKCEVPYKAAVISAHRHPGLLADFVLKHSQGGTSVFIGIAGMAAALPGAIAADATGNAQVLGVGLTSDDALAGLDALLSITRMPPGVPVACMGLNRAGLENAALFACGIVAKTNHNVREKFKALRAELAAERPPQENATITPPPPTPIKET